MVGLIIWIAVVGSLSHDKSLAGKLDFRWYVVKSLLGAVTLGICIPLLGAHYGVQLPWTIPALLGAGLVGTWMLCSQQKN